jgi:hypothetical protein
MSGNESFFNKPKRTIASTFFYLFHKDLLHPLLVPHPLPLLFLEAPLKATLIARLA